MNAEYTIFAVDDDDIICTILESMLETEYAIETFASAELCLARLTQKVPNLFLMDVGLPGISGHDLCRQIKQLPQTSDIPVVFISSHDKASEILAGYDAGGEDYIVKPFNPIILTRQIENLRRAEHDKRTLFGQAQSSEEMTSIVLANLDEYAVLIKFLRSLNECHDTSALLDLLFQLLAGYHLQAAIQLRLPNQELTISDAGKNRPLEVAVINNVRGMGRIFEFKSRAAFNFDAITLMVNNMPLSDPDLCGRLRDNVLIAAECANAKLQAQQVNAENTRSKSTAAELLTMMQTVVADFERKYLRARYQGATLTQHLLDELTRAFASLGLSEDQEIRIDTLVRTETSKFAKVYDFSDEVHSALTVVAARLAEILSPPVVSGQGAEFHPSARADHMASASAQDQAAAALF
jgi:DNA-binding response OmpR family regulator